jgi:hypothetical protein
MYVAEEAARVGNNNAARPVEATWSRYGNVKRPMESTAITVVHP